MALGSGGTSGGGGWRDGDQALVQPTPGARSSPGPHPAPLRPPAPAPWPLSAAQTAAGCRRPGSTLPRAAISQGTAAARSACSQQACRQQPRCSARSTARERRLEAHGTVRSPSTLQGVSGGRRQLTPPTERWRRASLIEVQLLHDKPQVPNEFMHSCLDSLPIGCPGRRMDRASRACAPAHPPLLPGSTDFRPAGLPGRPARPACPASARLA